MELTELMCEVFFNLISAKSLQSYCDSLFNKFELSKSETLPKQVFQRISGLKEIKGFQCSECDFNAKIKVTVEKHNHPGPFTVLPCLLLKTGSRFYTLASYDSREETILPTSYDADHEEMIRMMRSTVEDTANVDTFFFTKYPWKSFYLQNGEYINKMLSKESCEQLSKEVIELVELKSLEFCQVVNSHLYAENVRILALSVCGDKFRRLETSASVKNYAKHLFGFIVFFLRHSFNTESFTADEISVQFVQVKLMAALEYKLSFSSDRGYSQLLEYIKVASAPTDSSFQLSTVRKVAAALMWCCRGSVLIEGLEEFQFCYRVEDIERLRRLTDDSQNQPNPFHELLSVSGLASKCMSPYTKTIYWNDNDECIISGETHSIKSVGDIAQKSITKLEELLLTILQIRKIPDLSKVKDHLSSFESEMAALFAPLKWRFLIPRFLWKVFRLDRNSIADKKAVVYDYLNRLINKRREWNRTNKYEGSEWNMDVMQRLLISKEKGALTEDEIIGEVLGFFMAGHETTGILTLIV